MSALVFTVVLKNYCTYLSNRSRVIPLRAGNNSLSEYPVYDEFTFAVLLVEYSTSANKFSFYCTRLATLAFFSKNKNG